MIRAHTAMHVLKGAVAEVLGQRKFTFSSRGVLRFEADRPVSPQEVSRLETSANSKVQEDAEVLEFEMDRGEAEGHFGKGIFDLAPSSSPTGVLRVARIPDWEASCCSSRHVESTGSIGVIKVDGAKYDPAKKEAELTFHIV